MKPSFTDLTLEEQLNFGNGCTMVPDFIFTASCRHHDFNYSRGGYLRDKIKADWDMCSRMFNDAMRSHHPITYGTVSIIYFIGLTILPLPYLHFTWGKWRSKEEILLRDRMAKNNIWKAQ